MHNHPTLSRIASATQQASSPSPSDTSQSTTTEDQPPADSQHNDHPAEEKPPQSLTERQPSASTGDSKSSSEGAGSTLPRPSLSLEDPLVLSPKPQAGLRDPSLPSITMLSSDISSIQPREASVVQPHPFPVSSRLTGVPHKATPDASVRVPFGELEPSDGSFESTGTSTATSESTAASDGNPPLFQRVAPLTGFNTAGLSKTNLATPNAVDAGQLHEQPSVTVSDVTASDVQDLTSTTSKSITSGSSDASSGNDGETRPPIKGILKHTLPGEQRTSAVAPSIPPGKGMYMYGQVLRRSLP